MNKKNLILSCKSGNHILILILNGIMPPDLHEEFGRACSCHFVHHSNVPSHFACACCNLA